MPKVTDIPVLQHYERESISASAVCEELHYMGMRTLGNLSTGKPDSLYCSDCIVKPVPGEREEDVVI